MCDLTLSKYLKQYDLTIKEVCAITGRNRQTLYNWYNQDRQFFIVLLYGVLCAKAKNANSNFVLDFELPF